MSGGLQAAVPHLVLASQSRFRLALLRAAGLEVTAAPAGIDEAEVKEAARREGAGAEATALLLAGLKAQHVARRAPEALVIGADQILVCEGIWFDKPADLADARAHLVRLRGRRHTLVTAVVCRRGEAEVWRHVAQPRLTMRDFSDAFLDAYLAAEGAVLTSTVGAYRIEGPGMQLFSAVEGEHAAIMGLPMLSLLGFLRQHGALVG